MPPTFAGSGGKLLTSAKRHMTTHLIIPEGLAAHDSTPEETFYLSDYFEAVLQQLLKTASTRDLILLAPGNPFGYPRSEEEYARQYLQQKRPDLKIHMVSGLQDRPYLDTFDNARLLRTYLQQNESITTEHIILYCNLPHQFRSWAMFRLCGFNIKQVIGCHPQNIQRQIVSRLWFYDYPSIQRLYECVAFVYDLGRWIVWKGTGSS